MRQQTKHKAGPETQAPARHTTGPAELGLIDLHTRHVVVKHVLPGSGIAVKTRIPLGAYHGIGVKVEAAQDEDLSCKLMLVHPEKEKSVTILADESLDEVIAEWRIWGRRLNVPELLLGSDGGITEIVRRLGQVEVDKVQPRRRFAQFAERRPRFLTRRKVGAVHSLRPCYREREIIART